MTRAAAVAVAMTAYQRSVVIVLVLLASARAG
jgi:hypothetical protein